MRCLLLLLVLFAACKPARTFHTTQPKTSEALKKAVAAINEAVGCTWLYAMPEGQGDVLVVSDTGLVKSDGDHLRGFYDLIARQIDVETFDEYNTPAITHVILHEVGHAVGLDHEDGVMLAKFHYMPFEDAVQSFAWLAHKHNVINCKPLEEKR